MRANQCVKRRERWWRDHHRCAHRYCGFLVTSLSIRHRYFSFGSVHNASSSCARATTEVRGADRARAAEQGPRSWAPPTGENGRAAGYGSKRMLVNRSIKKGSQTCQLPLRQQGGRCRCLTRSRDGFRMLRAVSEERACRFTSLLCVSTSHSRFGIWSAHALARPSAGLRAPRLPLHQVRFGRAGARDRPTYYRSHLCWWASLSAEAWQCAATRHRASLCCACPCMARLLLCSRAGGHAPK